MIITPQELEQWVNDGQTFRTVDIRPADQCQEFPLTGVKPLVADTESIPEPNGQPMVLICQFGIITEGLIIEKELDETYSLLGGALAWEALQSEKQDLSRWSRQTVLPEIGLEGQKKLLKAQVSIVGMGGLGCPAAQSLLAAGIGRLKIIDGDKVELSNLHRQPLYGAEDIGRSKVQVAKAKLKKLNESAVIETMDAFFNADNGLDFIHDAHVVIDATDNIQTRLLIDRFSKETGVPMVYGGLFRYEGQVAVLNVNGSAGYSELFPEPPSGGETCADAGVLGMLPGVIGNIQALETVKLIVGIKPNLAGKLLVYDGMNHSTQTIEL